MSGSFRKLQRLDNSRRSQRPQDDKEAKQGRSLEVSDLPIKQIVKGGDERMIIVLMRYDTAVIRAHVIKRLENRSFLKRGVSSYHFVRPEAFFPMDDHTPFSDRHTDEQVIATLQRWTRAWCNPNVVPFKLNKSILEPTEGGVDRVDLIHGRPWERGQEEAVVCIREVSDFLAGQGPTMLSWFMRPHIQFALRQLALVKKRWASRDVVRLILRKLSVQMKDNDETRFQALTSTSADFGQIMDWEHASDEERVAGLEKIQKRTEFLQNALDGRGDSLDGHELFKILYDNDEGLPATVNRAWWYDQVRVSWDRHRRGGEAKELSWAGKMAARLLPTHCLFAYIENHFPRGAARIEVVQDKSNLEELHHVVRATKTQLLSQWVGPDPLGGQRELGFNLASYSANFLAGRVRLLKE
jgi:hypothetical protein